MKSQSGAVPSGPPAVPPVPPITSREQAEVVVREMAELAVERKKLGVELEVELAAVRKKGEPKIAVLALKILKREIALREWAEKAPGEFADKKSTEMLHGTVGFRTSPWSLVTRSGETWEKVLAKLTGRFRRYVRIEEDVNKQLIKADALATPAVLSDEDLAGLGLKLAKSEEFYVSLKAL